MTTKPQVFIIESLRFKDESDDLFEGNVLSQMLRLTGSEPRYVYLRTRQELEKVIDKFKDSNFRYLHISCHGDSNGIGLTLDDLSFSDLAKILAPCLEKRRIFFSSCRVMNERLAAALLKGTNCYSIIGPSKNINFDRATAFWSSFYHLMLRDEARSMKHDKLQEYVASLQNIFGVHMRYFSTSKNDNGFKEIPLITNHPLRRGKSHIPTI
jgi:hypothetical protein